MALNLTQPAVSQHIHWLEDYYGIKLVVYTGKKLQLTEQGRILHEHLLTVHADSLRLQKQIGAATDERLHVTFGATLTIGEYVMPKLLGKVLTKFPKEYLTMLVGNTQTLLAKLDDAEADFVLIEGFFEKDRYHYEFFSEEPFIAVCAPGSEAAKARAITDLFKHRLIVREEGSGTREIFLQHLLERSHTFRSFDSLCEIGNMSAIKQLVAEDIGISFLYKAAVAKELKEGSLVQIPLKDFDVRREFNFVFLKNSQFQELYMRMYGYLKQYYDE